MGDYITIRVMENISVTGTLSSIVNQLKRACIKKRKNSLRHTSSSVRSLTLISYGLLKTSPKY